jgi:hypothetical protein
MLDDDWDCCLGDGDLGEGWWNVTVLTATRHKVRAKTEEEARSIIIKSRIKKNPHGEIRRIDLEHSNG